MEKQIEHFKVIGISHHKANVSQREQFALSGERIALFHKFLNKHTKGGFVISTCNRTEVYFIHSSFQTIIDFWATIVDLSREEFSSFLYQYQGKTAINYLFRVGTGLDSQILGDFQIIGQIKSACKLSIEQGAGNPKITRLVDVLLKASKRVKNETNLSSGVASMAYAAIQHAQNERNLSACKVLVYGAGKMGYALSRKLAELMPKHQLYIANRTQEKAQAIAKAFSIQDASTVSLVEMVKHCDILISSAAVKSPLFTNKLLEQIDVSNHLFIDLSMPRSICPELAKKATVINLDQLQDVQNETFELRKQSIPAAEHIVSEELADFYQWIESREIAPVIHAIKEKLTIYKEIEIKRLQKSDPMLQQEQIEQVAEALINKVTTQCIKHIKRNNNDALAVIQDIFELDQASL